MPPALSRATEGFLLDRAAQGRSGYTLRNYRISLERLGGWLEADPPVDQITTEQMQRFLVWLREGYRTGRGKPLSPKSLKNEWGAVSAFWGWASSTYQIPNPFTVPAPKAPLPTVEPFRADEVERLLDATPHTETGARRPTRSRDRAILLTLLDTGLRVSELCGARIQDLETETGRIHVLGKGSVQRFVYLGKVGSQAVWLYLAERYPDRPPDPEAPLFALDTGAEGPMNRHSVRQLLARLGERAGVADVHPHRFRHTFAIEYLRNGGDLFTLQRLLGHSSLEMVRRYLALAEADLAQAHRKASPADRWGLK